MSALALSRDDGKSFVKIGEILSPHSTLDETAATGLSVTADGALVEADDDGYPVTDSSSADRRQSAGGSPIADSAEDAPGYGK